MNIKLKNGAAAFNLAQSVIMPALTTDLRCQMSRKLWAVSSEIADLQRARVGETVGVALGRFTEWGDAPHAESDYTCTLSAQINGCKAQGVRDSVPEHIATKAFATPYKAFVEFSNGVHRSSSFSLVLETFFFRNLATHLRVERGQCADQTGVARVWIFSGPVYSKKEAQRRVIVLKSAFHAFRNGHDILSGHTFKLPTPEQLLSV